MLFFKRVSVWCELTKQIYELAFLTSYDVTYALNGRDNECIMN